MLVNPLQRERVEGSTKRLKWVRDIKHLYHIVFQRHNPLICRSTAKVQALLCSLFAGLLSVPVCVGVHSTLKPRSNSLTDLRTLGQVKGRENNVNRFTPSKDQMQFSPWGSPLHLYASSGGAQGIPCSRDLVCMIPRGSKTETEHVAWEQGYVL